MIRATYNMSERMFSMERGGCAAAAAAAQATHGKKPKSSDMAKTSMRHKTGAKEAEAEASARLPPPDTSKTGQAPWQEGVLERLRDELSPQEYNMYVVHHGRMLVSFGQIEPCTPRERDFVYGSLEPIPVQTLRSFKVMIHPIKLSSLFFPEGGDDQLGVFVIRSLTAITTSAGFISTTQQRELRARPAAWTRLTSPSRRRTGSATRQPPPCWATLRRRSWDTRSKPAQPGVMLHDTPAW